jgi:hypothetical protein
MISYLTKSSLTEIVSTSRVVSDPIYDRLPAHASVEIGPYTILFWSSPNHPYDRTIPFISSLQIPR